ncbi:MAG: S41 family peptidase, partial [Fimbriimonadales bacterium]|nr:S41 family peptidase [Fimbriimonadales bacterium]
LNGVDWQAVRKRYEPRVRAARSDEELYEVLGEMVGELKQSHFAVYSPKHLIASQQARGRLADGEAGITAQLVEGQALVVRVYEGSPAAASGVRPGDQLLAVDETPVQQLLNELRFQTNRQLPHRASTPTTERFLTYYVLSALLNGRAGTEVRLRLRTLTGEERDITLTRAPIKKASEPIGLLPPVPLRLETRMLNDRIGYIAFNAFLPAVMEPVRKAVREMRQARALIIDLRGNMGGIGWMAGGIGGLLTDREIPMGVIRLREGFIPINAYPQPGAFKGPVVILTDEATLSTAEIMAGALKEAGRAVVIGRPTPGYALPSKLVELPHGGLLQCVIADYRTPKGRRLEGVGVKPTIEVSLTRDAFRHAPDPILQAAVDYLARH